MCSKVSVSSSLNNMKRMCPKHMRDIRSLLRGEDVSHISKKINHVCIISRKLFEAIPTVPIYRLRKFNGRMSIHHGGKMCSIVPKPVTNGIDFIAEL